MSQKFKAFFAVFAVAATFGAVQLASGHDLTGLRQLASNAPASEVNRAAKADRAASKVAQSQTVGLDDTSVVVRIPVVKEAVRNRPAVPSKPGSSKNAIACEPPVSVLTEVAKLLQPGRCIT